MESTLFEVDLSHPTALRQYHLTIKHFLWRVFSSPSLLPRPNPRLQKRSLFVERRTPLPRWRVRLQRSNRMACHPRPTARLLNQLIESGQFRFLQGELSLIRANPLSAPPAAPSSVLSIRYPGHTRLWTGGGASAGGEISWLPSGWLPPTRILPVRIENPLAKPIGGTRE